MPNPPTFNTWTVIFLFAAVQGILFSMILYFNSNPKGRIQIRYITWLMVMFCLMIVEYVLWWTGYITFFPHAMSVTASFTYLFGPLLFFYFRRVFRGSGHEFKKDWPHWIPFLIFILFHLPLYMLSSESKLAYIQGTVKQQNFIPWPWLNIIQLSLYVIICFYEYREEAENTREVKKWFKLILSLFALYIFSMVSYYVLVSMPGFSPMWDYMISAAMMLFIYSIAVYGYFNHKVFNGFGLIENTAKSKYTHSTLNDDFGKQTLNKLGQLMTQDKLFVDDEINLDKLALRLNITRHQLSQVLNEHAGMNFFEYINSRRIEEAKLLLTNTSKKELNIIEIAYRVGYSNKVTFNNTFKKHTGMTPSEYRMTPKETMTTQILPIRENRSPGNFSG